MSVSEKIRILLVKRGNMSEAQLARKMQTSPQNINNQLRKDNFREQALWQIAETLNCDLEINFVMRDTGEKI